MKRLFIVFAFLVAAGSLVFWFFYPLRSYIAMGVYSLQQSGESVMYKKGFNLEMSSGNGWYPFVLTYNAADFRDWSGINADMSIIYNFGAFDALTRTSSIYDTKSDKYSSFYGAYIIKKDSGIFGLSENGEINLGEIETAVRYDYTQLVMSAFGCNNIVFNINGVKIQKDAMIDGIGDWTRIDAQIEANGAAHNYYGDRTPYLQYGPPTQKVKEDFALITLYGRIYAKYLAQYDCTALVFVITPSEHAAEECYSDILSKTKITQLKQGG